MGEDVELLYLLEIERQGTPEGGGEDG